MDFVFQGGSPHKGASAKPLATYVHAVQKPVDARLAQSAECNALNLVVVGSSPTVGVLSYCGRCVWLLYMYEVYNVRNDQLLRRVHIQKCQ